MDFAKKLMENYGWKDGNGLGKNMDGIVKPLRASLKFDNAGFGADQAASDFNNHWWERVFNEATSNIAVVKDKDNGVCMGLKNRDETVDITTKGYSINKLKKRKDPKGDQKYENFLQSSLLTEKGNEVENSKEIKIDDIEVKKFKQLTDEELFKACGGRTAHKGARHGLKLSGKLARLEMQEQEMLASILAKKKVPVVETISGKKENSVERNEFALEVKRKSKKRTKSCRESNVTSDENKSEKRKKTKQNKCIEDQLRGEETKDRIEEESVPSVKIQHTKIRKNKTANKNIIIHLNVEIAEDAEYGDNIVKENVKNTTGIKNKKCKKNKKDREKMVVDAQDQEETQETVQNHQSARQNGNLGDDKSAGSKNNARKRNGEKRTKTKKDDHTMS